MFWRINNVKKLIELGFDGIFGGSSMIIKTTIGIIIHRVIIFERTPFNSYNMIWI